MFKRYNFRLYPTKKQQELIQKTFGCVRFVYNQSLSYRKKEYVEKKKQLSRFDCINWKNHYLKNTYLWLKEVDAHALNSAIDDMDIAFLRFLERNLPFQSLNLKKENNLIEQFVLEIT